MEFRKCDYKEEHELFNQIDHRYVRTSVLGFDMPARETSGSAGYDFHSPYNVLIKKGKTVRFPLLVKVSDMKPGTVLLMFNRSGLSMKHGLQIDNAVGVIDSDYKQSIWIQVTNHGRKDYRINVNDKVIQGVFVNYTTVDNEKTVDSVRTGGFGSTGR